MVVDGPLRGGTHLERAVGYIKYSRQRILPARTECARRRAGPAAAHTGVPDGHHLGPVFLVPAIALRPGRALGRVIRLEASVDLDPKRLSSWRTSPSRCCLSTPRPNTRTRERRRTSTRLEAWRRTCDTSSATNSCCTGRCGRQPRCSTGSSRSLPHLFDRGFLAGRARPVDVQAACGERLVEQRLAQPVVVLPTPSCPPARKARPGRPGLLRALSGARRPAAGCY